MRGLGLLKKKTEIQQLSSNLTPPSTPTPQQQQQQKQQTQNPQQIINHIKSYDIHPSAFKYDAENLSKTVLLSYVDLAVAHSLKGLKLSNLMLWATLRASNDTACFADELRKCRTKFFTALGVKVNGETVEFAANECFRLMESMASSDVGGSRGVDEKKAMGQAVLELYNDVCKEIKVDKRTTDEVGKVIKVAFT